MMPGLKFVNRLQVRTGSPACVLQPSQHCSRYDRGSGAADPGRLHGALRRGVLRELQGRGVLRRVRQRRRCGRNRSDHVSRSNCSTVEHRFQS